MASVFKDFIPAGEDPGALGAGFRDFVPPKEPVKQPENPVPPQEEPVVTPSTPAESPKPTPKK